MTQDVPQEPDGQETSTSPSLARTSHSHVAKYTNEADTLPAEVSSASEMVDSDELQTFLVEWMETPDWATSQTYLQTHPALLSDEAEQALALLDQLQPDERVRALVRGHQQLLKTSRQQGIAAAYSLPHDPEGLNNAGVALIKRYWAHGRVEDLGRALQFWQEAIILTLPTDLERPRYLSNLGSGLHARYARTGAMEDLEAAVTIFREAVNNTPLDNPERSERLNNLGAGLQARYGHTGAMEDLEAAIATLQEVVATTPPNDPERSGYLGNLGGGLHDRYARTGALEDLEAAIKIYQEAVTATSLDNPERSKYLDSLGKGLYDRYGRIRGLGDLEAAIAPT